MPGGATHHQMRSDGGEVRPPTCGLSLLFRVRRQLGWYGAGYIQLKGELIDLERAFERLEERSSPGSGSGQPGGARPSVKHGRALLDYAWQALDCGEIEQGWRYVHTAELEEISALDDLGDQAELETKARTLLDQAIDGPDTRRNRTVQHLLADQNGTLKPSLEGHQVREASKLLHEHHQREHLKRKHQQEQFNGMLSLGVLALIGFLAWVNFSPSANLTATETGSFAFIVSLPLAGVLGASLFSMRSMRRQSTSSRTPQHLTGRTVAVARAGIGAFSALGVYLAIRSGLVTLPPELTSASALLLFAFAAGHTEWVAPRAADAAARVVEQATPVDEP